MSGTSPVLMLVVALIAAVIGAAIAYVFVTARFKSLEEALRERLTEKDESLRQEKLEKDQLQAKVATLLPLEGEITSLRSNLSDRVRDIANLQDTLESMRDDFSREREERISLEKRLENERNLVEEKEAGLARERQRFLEEKKQLEDSFANLSKTALAHAQQSFIELANEKFKDARQVSNEELNKVLAPMQDTLDKLQVHTRDLETKRAESYAALNEQVRGLMSTTSQLSNALKRPEVRGNWGEYVLKNAAEAAGLTEGTDYEMQVSLNTDEGRQRPDMVVKLPNKRVIIVDSKAPMDAYLQAMDIEDPVQKQLKLKEHANQVRKKIRELSSKSYQDQFAGAADFVVLFVPSEALYQVAIQEDPTLVQEAFDRKVVLANPMTLVALLRTVANGMQQQKAYENALVIAKLGGDLHDSVATFASHFIGVGKSLKQASERYNDTVGSLERNVLSKARKMRELGAKAVKGIEEPDRFQGDIRLPELPTKSPSDTTPTLEVLITEPPENSSLF